MSKLAHSNQETMDEIEAHTVGALHFKDVLKFGKYKGSTVEQVIFSNAQYILWCAKNLDRIQFSEPVLERAREMNASTYGVPMDRIYSPGLVGNSPYDDDDDDDDDGDPMNDPFWGCENDFGNN